MRFDATRAPTPPTDSPSACTLTLTLPTSLHREPLSLHRPLLHPPLSPRDPRSTLLHGVPRFPPSHSTRTHFSATTLHCAFSVLYPPIATTLAPSSSLSSTYPSPSFSLSLVSFPIRLGSRFPPSGISLLFSPSSSSLLTQFALRRRASSITRFFISSIRSF